MSECDNVNPIEAVAKPPAAEAATMPSDTGGQPKIDPVHAPAPKNSPTPIEAADGFATDAGLLDGDAPAMPRREARRKANRTITLFAAKPEAEAAPKRTSKFALLAASVAFAAAVGALVGQIGTSGVTRLSTPSEASPAALGAEQAAALQGEMAQMRTELSAIRTSVETSTRNTNTQFAKFVERVDRVEKSQAEPLAKLAKVAEALERLERRISAANDTTGSVPVQIANANVPRPPAPLQPQGVQGWVLQDVYRGVALISGGRLGTIEVEAGDTVPGLGRIEAIKKQEGRWVVITPKGIITAAR